MITVVTVAGLVTVQDAGRPGRMHEGVPPGGPLDPRGMARANAAAGNAPGVAALEVIGSATFAVSADTRVATDDGAMEGRIDRVVRVTSSRRAVAYLAVRGGVDVPIVLGGRGTLLAAGLGGLDGRGLRAGDRLRAGDAPEIRAQPPEPADPLAPLLVVAGPDRDRFAEGALDLLLGVTFIVSPRSDRVGTRLAGPVVPRPGEDAALSAPMVRGALQVPASGEPIVLGPDHPTTGGYPVLATLVRESWAALGCRPIGARVRFVLAR